jgi:hypothetical protein
MSYVFCHFLATAPPKANVRAIAKIHTHFGFSILDFRLSEQEFKNRFRNVLRIRFFP